MGREEQTCKRDRTSDDETLLRKSKQRRKAFGEELWDSEWITDFRSCW